MKKIFFSIATLLWANAIIAQNVGIATTTPSEKLDVNGNVNVSGTIKVNGIDGTAGQVLMKNSAGVFSWGNMAQYNHTLGFSSTSSLSNTLYTWTVPASVTKVFVECWAGGGGGATGGGGGGGGYAAYEWSVTPGSVFNITVGGGGAGATTATTDAVDGSNTIVQIGTAQLIAYGGDGGHVTIPGFAGEFGASFGAYYYGQSGTAGECNTESYGVYNATIYYTAIKFGSGGIGGNTQLLQHNGGFRSYNTSTAAIIKNTNSLFGVEPSGGGGADATGGKNGAPGLVIIHY